jgi:c-di-GMP-binding flagellar brake protein YcgR
VSIDFQERRRSPRVVTDGKPEFRVARRFRVRLLDISSTGALLATEDRLPVGVTARMQLLLAGSPFEAFVEVRREEPASDGRGRVSGVTMSASQPGHQDTLDDFLRRAGA